MKIGYVLYEWGSIKFMRTFIFDDVLFNTPSSTINPYFSSSGNNLAVLLNEFVEFSGIDATQSNAPPISSDVYKLPYMSQIISLFPTIQPIDNVPYNGYIEHDVTLNGKLVEKKYLTYGLEALGNKIYSQFSINRTYTNAPVGGIFNAQNDNFIRWSILPIKIFPEAVLDNSGIMHIDTSTTIKSLDLTISFTKNSNNYRLSSYMQGPYNFSLDEINAYNDYELPLFPPTPPSPPSNNPYAPGGTSGTGGGNGTFDRTSDPVDFSPLPQLSAARAGLISLFNPSLSELNELSSRLWSKDFLDAITNFFTDPSDIIISLGIVPVQPPISGRADLQAGLISTGISMNVISSQFMSFNCGTLELKPFYDAALDYSPYTKISIYLPYIGVRQLNTDEVMNNTIALRYNIDLFSGACVAEVKVGNSVLYTFNGNVVSQVPISARSYDSLISAVIQGATAIGGAIATGGATAGSALSATVNVVQSAKPEVLRSGNASANIGLLAGQIPYLIFEIPNQSMPENNQTFVGFPANITATLSDLSGYTQVDTVHLENIPATSSELSEIENLLKGGIIL